MSVDMYVLHTAERLLQALPECHAFTSYKDRYIFSLGSTESRILTGVADGLSVLCDIIIVAALSYYLHSKRTGFKRYVFARRRGLLLTNSILPTGLTQ